MDKNDMKIKKKSFFIFLLCICLLLPKSVYAASEACISEIQTKDDKITLFIKNIPSITSAEVQIGTQKCGAAEVTSLRSMNQTAVDTLILIDNSQSISEANRQKVQEILKNVIVDHMDRERFSVATFSEIINSEINFSEDYSGHLKAVENIGYVNQNTYIIDVLYQAIETIMSQNDSNYKRIILISDGVDDNRRGYTKDELIRLIQTNLCPIYSITSMWEEDQNGVENMFELSRAAKSAYFLLDDYDNPEQIADEIGKDYEVYAVTAQIPQALMDGGSKNIRVILQTAEGEQSVETETVIPFLNADSTGETQEAGESTDTATLETTPSMAPTDSPIPTSEKEDGEEGEHGNKIYLYIAIGAFVFFIVTIVALISLLKKRKKREESTFGYAEESTIATRYEEADCEGQTVAMTQLEESDSESTVGMWDKGESLKNLNLTDLRNHKEISCVLRNELILGRSRSRCDVAFDYEKTVSGTHCRLSLEKGKVYITDLKSSNGTWLNRERVDSETEIKSGDHIKLGALELEIKFI